MTKYGNCENCANFVPPSPSYKYIGALAWNQTFCGWCKVKTEFHGEQLFILKENGIYFSIEHGGITVNSPDQPCDEFHESIENMLVSKIQNALDSVLSPKIQESRLKIKQLSQDFEGVVQHEDPPKYFDIIYHLGVEYCKLSLFTYLDQTERNKNTNTAIKYFNHALSYYTKENSPLTYADIKENLGDILPDLDAVKSYQEAMQILTKERYPQEYQRIFSKMKKQEKKYFGMDSRESQREPLASEKKPLSSKDDSQENEIRNILSQFAKTIEANITTAEENRKPYVDTVESGISLIISKNYTEAMDKFAKAVEINPLQDLAWAIWGGALAHIEKYPEAIEKCAKAVEINPQCDHAWAFWGMALNGLRKYSEAIEKCAKAVKINPKNETAWGDWGKALFNLQKYSEVIEVSVKATKNYPQDVHIFENWGQALFMLQRYPEAAEKYAKVAEMTPQTYNSWLLWGLALYKSEDYAEATEKYAQAVEIDPDLDQAWLAWGRALFMLGKPAEAAEKAAIAVKINPQNAIAWETWGSGLNHLGKKNEAIEKFEKAVELDPLRSMTWFCWAATLCDLGKYAESSEKYTKALEISPNDHVVWEGWEKDLSLWERSPMTDAEKAEYAKARQIYEQFLSRIH